MERKDACNVKAAPIPLLLVWALRYVGRGWISDDLAENAAISEVVLRFIASSTTLSVSN